MVRLTVVGDPFEATVVRARLGADGILAQCRGGPGSTYPLRTAVELWVMAGELDTAVNLLSATEDDPEPPWVPLTRRRLSAALSLVAALVTFVGGVAAAFGLAVHGA